MPVSFRYFNVKNVYPVFNGSGDTSYAWAEIINFKKFSQDSISIPTLHY